MNILLKLLDCGCLVTPGTTNSVAPSMRAARLALFKRFRAPRDNFSISINLHRYAVSLLDKLTGGYRSVLVASTASSASMWNHVGFVHVKM